MTDDQARDVGSGQWEGPAAGEAVTYGRRLRDLEAAAFRHACTLAEHSERLTISGGTLAHIDFLNRRLDRMEKALSDLLRSLGDNP